MEIIKPRIELQPYIKAFWALKACNTGDKCRVQRIIPSGLVELTFYFNSAPEYQRYGKSYKVSTVLNGQHTDYYEIRIPESLDMFSVVFSPLGARVFFDFPMDEIFNQNVPVELLDKKPGNDVAEKIRDTLSFNGRVALLEHYFLNRLQDKDFWNIKRLVSGLNALSSNGGLISVNELANKACLSTRQFKRVFSNVIGTTPKSYARIIRLQKTLFTGQKQPEKHMTNLAYMCGYADQAHMINEFKTLTGYTPRQFFSLCQPYSDFYSM